MKNSKELGRSGCGLIAVLYQYLHEGVEEKHKKPQLGQPVYWLSPPKPIRLIDM
jgi:hypothetical protein